MVTLFELFRKVAAGKYKAAPPVLVNNQEQELLIDSNGNLLTSTGTTTTLVDLVKLAGNALASAGLNGVLSVGGSGADGAAMSAAYSNRIAGLVRQVLTVLTDNTKQTLLTDIMGRLHVRGASHDDTSQALGTYEVAPQWLQIAPEAVYEANNLAVATYFPSEDGMVMDGFTDLSITGNLTDADDTLTLVLQVTDDRDATPANRVWVPTMGYRGDLGYNTNSVVAASGSTDFSWFFRKLNVVYARWRITPITATNAINVHQRRIVP